MAKHVSVARAKTDDTEKVIAQLEGWKFSDSFARHAHIRKEDHRVVLDGFQVQVKPKSEAKAPWDYLKITYTIPAEQAFRPLSEGGCPLVP